MTYRTASELRRGDWVLNYGWVANVTTFGRGDEWVTVEVRWTDGTTTTFEGSDPLTLTYERPS